MFTEAITCTLSTCSTALAVNGVRLQTDRNCARLPNTPLCSLALGNRKRFMHEQVCEFPSLYIQISSFLKSLVIAFDKRLTYYLVFRHIDTTGNYFKYIKLQI